MEYVTFDSNGKQTSQGHLGDNPKPKVPTHGSISIKVGDQWLSFVTSEWVLVYTTDKPIHWGIPHDERQ